MKNKWIMYLGLLCLGFLGSCSIENDEVLFTDTQVEFDAASWNSTAAGRTYPIISRIPRVGTATTTSNSPALTRAAGTVTLRINLIGAQRSSAEQIAVSVVQAESTAISGTHYNVPATVTIPANSSFGELQVEILNPGATSGSVDLVLQLDGNANVKPAENYRRVGLRISQS